MNSILPAELIDNGVIPQETLIMIMLLPVVATIMGFARHIIGIKALGLYAPIILTYAYFQLGASAGNDSWTGTVLYGLKLGVALTFIVFVTSYLTHIVTLKLRIHYSPKIALVLTSVAVSFYLLIILADATNKTTFLNSGFLPIILIATVSEQFVSIMAKKNLKAAFSLSLTTVFISAVTFMLIIYKPFQDILINYPYSLLVTIVLNIIIGKFTGLRLLEYYRFRDILNKED